jgi:MSHA biogenesis protein MshG
MPTFDFQGRNDNGELIEGKRLAQTEDTLSRQLLKEGIIPFKIQRVEEKTNLWHQFKSLFQSGHVNIDELGMFARQMHTLLKTGVPITSALRQLADNTRNLPITLALYGIVERMESGQDMASSMQHYPRVFTPIMVSMIRIGQNSGSLDEAFLRLNQYLELEASALKRVKTALRYPAFVLFAIIAAIVLVNIFVIPAFSTVFTQANIELPWPTRMLISISQFFKTFWIYIIIFFTILIGSIFYFFRSPEGQYFWDRYQLKIPIFGKIIQKTMLLRFSHSFAIVIQSGIPLTEGMNLVAESINNLYARDKIITMRESVEHGKTLTQAAASSNFFTPIELQMLSVSEETGQLSQMLDEVAAYYRREVDYDLKKIGDLIEPILIIALSIMILILAFAVYLPIWNLIKIVKT